MVAATRPFVPIRVNQATDQEIWAKYDVDGVGVFLILGSDAKYLSEVPMKDLNPNAVLAAFLKTLPEVWEARKADAKQIVWQTDLAAAREAAAKDGRPIAAVVVKVTEPKPLPPEEDPLGESAVPKPDKAGATLLGWLDEIDVARHYERFVWVRVDWAKERPEAAKDLSISKAPAVALLGPDGKTSLGKPALKDAVQLAAALDKAATKAEAENERKRKAAERAAKQAEGAGE